MSDQHKWKYLLELTAFEREWLTDHLEELEAIHQNVDLIQGLLAKLDQAREDCDEPGCPCQVYPRWTR